MEDVYWVEEDVYWVEEGAGLGLDSGYSNCFDWKVYMAEDSNE